MVYRARVVVCEVKADFDPFGGEYTHVSFGYRVPIPRPPEADRAYPPVPRQIMYKHAMHLIVPREQWDGQFTMWGEYDLELGDRGQVSLNIAPPAQR